MTYSAWRKRTKLFDKYIYHGYHAMASLIAQAAYKAGERDGLKRGEELCKRSIELAAIMMGKK